MSDSNFPLLATKRIVISKDFDFIPSETVVTTETSTEIMGSNPFDRREDIVETTVTTTTPSSSREFTKVKVEFLLRSRESTSLSRWFSDDFMNNPETSEYAEYLKVYFIALDDSSAGLAGWLQDPRVRFRALRSANSLGALRGNPLRTAAAAITMAEILQNEKFMTTPVSDTSQYYQHDIYSEVEIDITNLDLKSSEKIHLIGFIHMDVESYTQDKGLEVYPEEPHLIESHGGDLIYDLLLERTDSLQIPFYKDSLYLNSEPYYGPAHYHTEENQGPDGYVGWMAGPPGGDMGPKLDVITTRNYKVVSSIYGLQNAASVFGLGPMFSTPTGPTGDALRSYLNSTIDRGELLDSSNHLIELTRASSYAESKLKKNFMKPSDTSAAFVSCITSQDASSGNLTNEGSHHASVVGIDYFKLVRDMSNYGDILNFHENKQNTELVERLLGSSQILDLTILRDRVTNNPYSFNDVDSLEYKIYDVNEPSKKLVNAQDDLRLRPLRPNESSYAGHLIPASTDFATVREINLATLNEGSGLVSVIPGYNRFFHVKDYDLFHNVQFGNYRYSMRLTLIDGIHRTIKRISESLHLAHRNISRFYNIASQPVIKNEEGVYVQGNFDYDTGRFHSSFSDLDNTETNLTVRIAYSSAVEFLTGQSPDEETMMQIECAIDPVVADLDSILFMRDILKDLVTSINEILKMNGDETQPDQLKKRGKTHVPSTNSGSKSRTIEVTVKCPDIVSALSEGTIVANYSNHQSEDEDGNDITPDLPNLGLGDYLGRYSSIQDRYRNNLLLPSSYSSVSFTPFRVEQYEVNRSIQPLPTSISTSGRTRNTIQVNTAPKIISSYGSFRAANTRVRSSHTIMINSARSQQNVFSSYMKKPASELVYNSFTSAGVVINSVGVPLNLGVSSTKNNNTSRAKEKLKDAFKQASSEGCLELSDELKAAIQSAAYNGVSKKEVMDTAESGYGNLNDILGVIGDTFNNMVALVGPLQDMGLGLSNTAAKALTEEQKFLGASTSAQQNYGGLDRYDIYDAEAAELHVVSPGSPVIKFSPKQAEKWIVQEMPSDTYLLVKAVPVKKEDAVVPVNNGYLLRI